VERVVADHGQQVAAGDELVRLRDPQLDLDFNRISGELQTAQARLTSIRARRSTRSNNGNPQDEERQMAAEEEQLKQQVVGLLAQLQVLERNREELRVASPIAGLVLTWNPSELLLDRPVREGQLLMTVADPAGPWVLEMRVPDADIGHILAAQKRGQVELPVTFLLATEPAVTHRGRVAQVALNSDAVGGQEPSVLVTVRLDNAVPAAARTGAGIKARIHCGQRPIGYVWLHDVIDAVRTQVLF
jgi:multidrug efflux pump subunit AcrA (membrane-fusion protein)